MKVFSKEKYFESCNGAKEYWKALEAAGIPVEKRWPDICDGKEVINGMCGVYVIHDNWCVDVDEGKTMTIKDFVEQKIAVWFDSLEQEKAFLKWCARNGLKWHGSQNGYCALQSRRQIQTCNRRKAGPCTAFQKEDLIQTSPPGGVIHREEV